VLLGFQYRGFFEKAYDELSPAERALKMAALFALLATAPCPGAPRQDA